jgi:hypothetical protein
MKRDSSLLNATKSPGITNPPHTEAEEPGTEEVPVFWFPSSIPLFADRGGSIWIVEHSLYKIGVKFDIIIKNPVGG